MGNLIIAGVRSMAMWGIDSVAINCGVTMSSTWEGVLILRRGSRAVYKFVSGVSVVNFDIISSCKFMVVTSCIICVCG